MAVRFLGNCDEVQQCECCGKKNLKATVALSIDDGDPVYFGVTCAARALKMQAKDVRAESRAADRAKAAAAAAAREVAWRTENEPWFAFLEAAGKGSDVFTRIESLGGYMAARAAFEAGRAT